ncbi:MAG: aminoacyl-tRNA hydrolase [Anaerolineales bacterium]|nr:MAG: aminoacyl-tRNA hydrolase [Anaerolineales bacterium]
MTEQLREMEKTTYLLIGLGNPGREYRGNRHNIGFMVLDHLAAKMGLTFSRMESKALVTKGDLQGHRLVLAKPQTYMNLSGQAVRALMNFYKIPLENLLVIYDDVDLPFETMRLRPQGGSAGQKGVQSIIENLGTSDFSRLRIGIGRPPGQMQAADYVLQNFSKAELDILPFILQRSTEAVITYVTNDIETAMNKFNASQEIT